MTEPVADVVDVLGEPLDLGAPAAGAAPPSKKRGRRSATGPNAGWLTRVRYDPDEGNRAADFSVPSGEYLQRFVVTESDDLEATKLRVRLPGMKAEHAFVPVDVRGVFLEPVLEGHTLTRWKPTEIADKRALKSFYESEPGKVKLLRESEFDDDRGRSGGAGHALGLMDNEFIPTTAGPFNKQLYTSDYLLMHSRAFELTNHNAIAAAAIKIMTRFTLGRGISFHIKHPKARAVWTQFWERNNMRSKIRQMARDLPWQGELMLRYYEHTKGQLDVRVMDPSTVLEIVTDPDDVEKVFYYHQQYSTPSQVWITGKIPSVRYIVAQVPPTNIQHLKINCSSTEKRGRSDLLPAMAWFKRLNDYYNGVTVKALLEANLVWKVKVRGDVRDVQALSTDPTIAELPPPGGIWWENENVNLEAVTGQLTASRASSGIGGELIRLIAASLNLPDQYFNVDSGGGTARATALVRTDPAVKTIEERQQLLRETLEEMYEREMALSLARGFIPPEAAREEPETGPDEDQQPDRGADEEDWLADRRAHAIRARLTGSNGGPQRTTLVRG